MPRRLSIKPLDKVWGTPDTEPWFRNTDGRQIGEVWFEPSDRTPILVKFLFTSEALSVQVHPGDEYARAHENGLAGKTEMWHILRAEPGGKIAVGLKRTETAERVREAALNGDIVDLLRWIEVRAGDTFFIPAGMIHAIGAGLAICEVQQLSDVTYRLYDFGRARELHLNRSIDVAELSPRDTRAELPVECEYFRTDTVRVSGTAVLPERAGSFLCIVLEGCGTLAGLPFETGQGFEIASGEGPIPAESSGALFLITSQK